MTVEAGVEHRFGPYGGQYVPETLMPALAELEAAPARLRADRLDRSDAHRDAIKQRVVAPGRQFLEHDALVGDVKRLTARHASELGQREPRFLRVGHAQEDMVEVIVDAAARHERESQAEALGALEGGDVRPILLDFDLGGKRRHGPLQVSDPQHEASERSRLSGSLDRDQDQLRGTSIGADQHAIGAPPELLHANVIAQESRHRVGVGHRERDVVEGQQVDRGVCLGVGLAWIDARHVFSSSAAECT